MTFADAIIAERIDQVISHLQMGEDINQLDEYGFTPLIEAAIANRLDIANLLIEYGANPNLQDSVGGTALHWAAENNNTQLAKLLLANGANPNAYNFSGQPVLVMPLLRQQQTMKKLLLTAGAHLEFAQDFINAKLLGHLFELVGTTDIIDPKNQFVEVDFEGFFMEFSLSVIAESVAQFRNHFAARNLRRFDGLMQSIVIALDHSAQLIRYQQYQVDLTKIQRQIQGWLQEEPLIIPVGYEGHAITFIKFGSILVKCDRREESRLYDNIVFYQINSPEFCSVDLIKSLIYERQTGDYINNMLPELLGLQPITTLKISAQISGNCSWANVEACVPAIFFLMLMQQDGGEENIPRNKKITLNFFQQWREWNRNRALQFCIQSFRNTHAVRSACKSEILGAILFQSAREEEIRNQEQVEMILKILMLPQYKYILDNYVRAYCYEERSDTGQQFLQMLRNYGYR